MMDSRPRLAAFDLDGTLAESKQPMTPEMGALLARLLEKMPVAVMSGAGFPQFQKQLLTGLPGTQDVGLKNLFLFPTNAAQCWIFKNGTWQTMHNESFSPAELKEIHRALTEALAEANLAEIPKETWGERMEDRGTQVTFSGLGQQAPIEAKKSWDPDKRKRLAVRNILLAKLPEYSISIGGMTSVDITRKGITKAHGLRKLSEITGIPITQMAYVGDALQEGGNDAVVKETGIQTVEISGPPETSAYIQNLLQA